MTRGPTPPRSQPRFDLRPTPVVLRLLLIHATIWVVTASAINFFASRAVADLLYDYLMVRPDGVIGDWYVWQPFTYMWLHDIGGMEHLLFNMLGLFFLGPPLERRWGKRTFLKFYVLTGVIAGAFSVLVGLILPGWFGAPTLGASGAIMGLVAAFSIILPTAEILLFFVVPVKARYLVWIALGVDVLMFFASNPSSNRIGIHTHIGGVLAAYLLITGNWRPGVAYPRFRRWLRRKGVIGGAPRRSTKRRPFDVIEGGRGKSDGDDDPPLLH